MTKPGSLGAWLLCARPATLTAAVVPVLVGTAVAYHVGEFALGPALAALLGAIWIQIGTNFANDVYDHESGADDGDRLGPTRAAQSGLLSGSQIRRGMWVAFGLATACGMYLTWSAGWPIVALGLASIASGIAYTGGPYPLGYNGLGDVFVLAFFGFAAVCGTVYVQAHQIPLLAWWCAVPIGALATCVLVINNIRDAPTDARVGKRTLAVRWGVTAARVEYCALMAISHAVPLALFIQELAPAAILAPLALLPIGAVLCVAVCRESGTILNKRLKQTAIFLLVFGLVLSAGLFWP